MCRIKRRRVKDDVTSQTWPHVGTNLKILSERKLLPGLQLENLPFCKHCVISKQYRLKLI